MIKYSRKERERDFYVRRGASEHLDASMLTIIQDANVVWNLQIVVSKAISWFYEDNIAKIQKHEKARESKGSTG